MKEAKSEWDMWENRNKITKIIAIPIPISMLCIPAIMINPIKKILPKGVSNNLTNILGTANITSHNATNKLNKPINKFIFFSEKCILYIIPIKYKISKQQVNKLTN